MKYKCLVFDHDDTVVNSSITLHYPALCYFLKQYRPGVTLTFEEHMLMNLDPGFGAYCKDVLKLDDREMAEELQSWKYYIKNRIPAAFGGIGDVMRRQKLFGGLICVASHSLKENILRDYRANALPEPDMVFGWEQPPEQRKPHPYPLRRIMQVYGLSAGDLIMIDDLKPGYDMAAACGVEFACAGWAYRIPEIEHAMRALGSPYCKTVAELETLLFGS